MSSIYFRDRFLAIQENIEKYIRGNSETVRLALICFFTQGHLLIEGVPGVAKTSLAKALACSIGGSTAQRVQFTPDLLPTDITGVEVFNQQDMRFEFVAGPVFANILIGDEINRASPKTQSALLQAMAERTVTVGRTTHDVPSPFFCVATQNPIEHQGTYPLPEAQLDRFLMRVSIGYPAPHHERDVIAQGLSGARPEAVGAVLGLDEVPELIQAATNVTVGDALCDYVVRIVTKTRTSPLVRLGASPRGAIALAAAAQVAAAARARRFTSPDDVKAMAVAVLAHRLLLTPEAAAQGATASEVVQKILTEVPVPPQPDGSR